MAAVVVVPCPGDAGCRVTLRAEQPAGLAAPEPCAACGARVELHREVLTPDGGLRGCLACGHPELFSRRHFPRAAGLSIVVVAAVLAPFTAYVSLIVAAAVDALLYRFGPVELRCYVCDAAHRGFAPTPQHPRYDHEIGERLKFGERAVMGKPMRPGGTADAPEPEH